MLSSASALRRAHDGLSPILVPKKCTDIHTHEYHCTLGSTHSRAWSRHSQLVIFIDTSHETDTFRASHDVPIEKMCLNASHHDDGR
jgi:hypothetical protein